MDYISIMIIGFLVTLIGVIAFSVSKILKTLKLNSVDMEKTVLDTSNQIISSIKSLTEDMLILKESNNSLIKDLMSKMNKQIDTSSGELKNILIKDKDDLLTHNDKIKSSIIDALNLVTVSIKKYQADNKKEIENNYNNTVRIINSLRLDNLINVSNEVGKYKNGIVEDEYLIQEVSFCKIVQLTDKQTGEITKVFYNENGQKSYTQTYLDNNLKYEMEYKDGLLFKGLEYNLENQIIFEYTYDETGEISELIEYEYDKSGNQIKKINKKTREE